MLRRSVHEEVPTSHRLPSCTVCNKKKKGGCVPSRLATTRLIGVSDGHQSLSAGPVRLLGADVVGGWPALNMTINLGSRSRSQRDIGQRVCSSNAGVGSCHGSGSGGCRAMVAALGMTMGDLPVSVLTVRTIFHGVTLLLY